VDATNAALETITIEFAGIDPNTLVPTVPESPPCGGVPCAFESFIFTGVGPDPVVTFSVTEGSTAIAFSVVPEPSTWVMTGLGFAALALVVAPRAQAFRPRREAP
jgi:hypothetical protein